VVLFLSRARGWRVVATLPLNGVALIGLHAAQALVIAITVRWWWATSRRPVCDLRRFAGLSGAS
jgi:hypothetical protein